MATSLERKLARWQAAGVIDEPTRSRIVAFEQSQHTPVVFYALGVLGAGTVALGLVSVIASNWEAIPGAVKLGGDLLIGVALAAATYVAVRRDRRWSSEVLITLFYGFTLASIALVGQVYQLDAPAYQGLLTWSVATGPLVLLGRSRYLAALVTAGLATTHALSLVGLFTYLDRRALLTASTERELAATLIFASPLLYVVLARVPWLVRNRPEFSRTVTALAWVAILLAGFGLQFVWYTDIENDQELGWSLGVTAVLVAVLVYFIGRVYPELSGRPRRTLALILGFAWFSLAIGTAFARPSVEVVGAILQVVWLGLFAWASIQLGLVRAFNALTALIALRVLAIYFEVFGSLLSTGVGLISGGALTLLVGWLWQRKTGDLAARLAPTPERSGDVA